MIAGACQADVGVLVISARKGEFETGFERGGQTREHAMLAKTLGVRILVVAINKMDDPTVEFSQARFDECVEKLTPFLKGCGYNIKKDVIFVPLSALTATNVLEKSDKMPWYDGPAFVEALDTLPVVERNKDAPLRLPILSKYKDMGTTVEGKVEQGTVKPGDKLWVMPNRVPVEVLNVWLDQDEVSYLVGGENARQTAARRNGCSRAARSAAADRSKARASLCKRPPVSTAATTRRRSLLPTNSR